MTESVSFLPTCVVDTVSPQVGIAAVRVLRRLGCDVVVPERATCCGQPAWNAGFADEAARVAATTLDALVDAEQVVVPAGSCATMMKVYWPELFSRVGDGARAVAAGELAPRIAEFSSFVAPRVTSDASAEAAGTDVSAQPAGRVAYHHSCHMLRELGVEDEPERLVAATGHERVEWPGDQRCCGFGGTFSVKQPEISVAMADDKLDDLAELDVEALVGCDQSCLLHLGGRLARRGGTAPTRHLAELLDDALTQGTARPRSRE